MLKKTSNLLIRSISKKMWIVLSQCFVNGKLCECTVYEKGQVKNDPETYVWL
jgi:hypothetical protein